MSETKRVIPFTNGSDFMYWRSFNCDICKKGKIRTANKEECCPMEYELSLACVGDGTIPIKDAKRIGGEITNKGELYFVSFGLRCLEFDRVPLGFNEVNNVVNESKNYIQALIDINKEKSIAEILKLLYEKNPYRNEECIKIYNESILGVMGNILPEKRFKQMGLFDKETVK